MSQIISIKTLFEAESLKDSIKTRRSCGRSQVVFKVLGIKKKSKKTTDAGKEAPTAANRDLNAIILKKKTKKKIPKETNNFEAKLVKAGMNGEAPTDGATVAASEEVVQGDMNEGTDIWAHNKEKAMPYNKFLERFSAYLHSAHLDLLSSGSKSFVILLP